MALHRLRVVGFDTLVSEKEGEKKFNAKHKKYEQEDWKISTERNKYEIGDVDQCLKDNKSPPRTLSKKYLGDNKSLPRRLSKKFLSDKRSVPEKSKIYTGDASRLPGTSVKIYLNDKISKQGTSKTCRPKTSEKFLNAFSFTSPSVTLKKQSFSFIKSDSDIFNITPKKKPTKRDLKLKSSDTSLTKQFQGSTNSPQRKRTLQKNLSKRNSRVHHKVQNVKENNDVRFLFTREASRYMRFCRKRAENESTKTKKKRIFSLPCDIRGVQESNRSMIQHLSQISFSKLIDKNKLPFKKLRRRYRYKPKPPQPVAEPYCKHHAMRVLKSDCGTSQTHFYHLKTGPHSQRSPRNDDYDQEKEQNFPCFCYKDETVEVSPSSFGLEAIAPCSCEACTCTNPCNVKVSDDTPLPQTATVRSEDSHKPNPCAVYARKQLKNFVSKTYKFSSRFVKCVVKPVVKRVVKRVIKCFKESHARKNLSGKCCLKYICFGLLIVLWCPCLLAGCLVRVVKKFINMRKCKAKCSFPMNSSENYQRSEYQRMSFENYMPKNRSSFMSSLASWCTCTADIVVNSFNAAKSAFKLNSTAPTGLGCSILTPSYPNPRKRYNLFYVGNRGWVMKPLRRRKIRSVASSRVVQSMPCKIIRQKRQPESSKKVYIECPVLTGKRYSRHREVLAWLTNKLRKGPKRRCACLNKHVAKLLQFRHHDKQVNIPLTFSNSADERININSKKINS